MLYKRREQNIISRNWTMITYDRYNQYRIMWVIVLFDLPTDTKKDIKQYSIFRKKLIQDGFAMFQFSIYIRNCPSRENAQVHINRVKNFLPPKGQIGILSITDKQFGEMEIFISKKEFDKPSVTQQLQLF